MNLSVKQKQNYRHREHTGGSVVGGSKSKGFGEGWSARLELADVSFYIES